MLEQLQKALNEYDKVFLVAESSVYAGSDWERFCNVVRTLEEADLYDRIFLFIEDGVKVSPEFSHMVLSHQEACDLWNLYMTYEFSDRFSVFTNGRQYSTIFRYSDAGILTDREAVAAILGYRKGNEDGQITL